MPHKPRCNPLFHCPLCGACGLTARTVRDLYDRFAIFTCPSGHTCTLEELHDAFADHAETAFHR